MKQKNLELELEPGQKEYFVTIYAEKGARIIYENPSFFAKDYKTARELLLKAFNVAPGNLYIRDVTSIK